MLKPLFIGSLGLTVLLAGSLQVARLTLPTTSCSVTEAQIDGLVLSKMSYADVSRLFGCQGELSSREDLGKIVFEKYQWRGAAWPFGKFEGTFVNGKLDETSKIWLKLGLYAKKAGA